VSHIQNTNYQVDKLHQKHYKSSFVIIVIYRYISSVSQLSANYVRCSSATACCYAIVIQMTLFPFSFPFPFPLVFQKLFPFP